MGQTPRQSDEELEKQKRMFHWHLFYRNFCGKFPARFFKKAERRGIIKMLQENQQEKEKIMWIDEEALARKDRNQKRKFEMLKKIAITLAGIALVAGVAAGAAVGIFIGKKTEAKQVDAKVAKAVKESEEKAAKEKPKKEEQKSTSGDEKKKEWNLTLVNNTHPLDENYQPELAEVENGYTFDARAAEALKEMLAAAREAGLDPQICSAYRTIEDQKAIYNQTMQDWIDQGMTYLEAFEETGKSVAYPGTSEHELGLAADIVSASYGALDEGQAETEEAKWLEENCYKYGFILRYPPDKISETGIIYESWHYRYVGKEDAKKIMESGVTLEEYLGEAY